jgi:hypothetical protein
MTAAALSSAMMSISAACRGWPAACQPDSQNPGPAG